MSCRLSFHGCLFLYGGIGSRCGASAQVYMDLPIRTIPSMPLTGSFYNPGPYSGYLAMIFPICLYEWLKRKEDKKTIPYYIVFSRNAIDSLCVACRNEPLGMDSCAAVSSVYVLWYAL